MAYSTSTLRTYEYKIVDERASPAIVVSQGAGKQIQITKARNKYSRYSIPALTVYRRLGSGKWEKIETVLGS